MNPSLSDLLGVATRAAMDAGKRTLDYFNTSLDVVLKADQSPVTAADLESEAILRDRISRAFPTHSILGEESGETVGSNSRYRWIIDPLDGTKSFIRGVPLYGVLVGVEVAGRPSVGVVYLPATNELVAAADGLGCTLNGRPCQVSETASLDAATVLTTSVPRCMAKSDAYTTLSQRAQFAAGWGDAYGHVLVATGRADIMLDPKVSPWDCAALLPILREAGGRLTSWSGEETIWAADAVSTNQLLNTQTLEVLRSANAASH